LPLAALSVKLCASVKSSYENRKRKGRAVFDGSAGAIKMNEQPYEERKRGGGLALATLVLLLFLGAALSVAAYVFSEPGLTVVESIAAGFGGLAGIIIGLFGAIVGVVLGVFGALLGLVAAGGAVALTLFIVGSPIIAIILIILLMRSRGQSAPDPDARQ
jgi:hypothetical protein